MLHAQVHKRSHVALHSLEDVGVLGVMYSEFDIWVRRAELRSVCELANAVDLAQLHLSLIIR